MRTKIEAGWPVGNDGKSFDGTVDKAIDAKGKLVGPGFIDIHVHSGHRASHRLIADNPNMNYSGGRDLELMGCYHASISHCPINIARRARSAATTSAASPWSFPLQG